MTVAGETPGGPVDVIVVDMYAQTNLLRQQHITGSRENLRGFDSADYFPGLGRVEHKPETPYNVDEQPVFYRHYNAHERILGRTMEDWLRPTIYIGRAFMPFPGGGPRPWCDRHPSLENYKRGVRAMFELCTKLGVRYWAGYDSDLAPECETLDEFHTNLEPIVDLIHDYQQKTGVKPLWLGVNYEHNYRYKNGSCTNPESSIFTAAGCQTKRAMDVACKLDADNFVYAGQQEGYLNAMNTDFVKELQHYAKFLKLVVDYRDSATYRGQLLMQTVYANRQRPNVGCRYTYDLFSSVCFLKQHGLDRFYKMVVRPGHEFHMANVYGCVGSVDVRHKHLFDLREAVHMMRTVVENGGLATGGLTFYLPEHEGTFDARDLLAGYVATIDNYAKALRIAVRLINDTGMNKNLQSRYLSFASSWGSKLGGSESSLEECEDQARKQDGNQLQSSARSEFCSYQLNRYIDQVTPK